VNGTAFFPVTHLLLALTFLITGPYWLINVITAKNTGPSQQRLPNSSAGVHTAV
jgi:hypothetical protein